MIAPVDLAERLRAAITGDSSAVTWLWDTFAGPLFRRLRQRYGHPGGLDPEDLLQDAFVFYLQHDARLLRRFLEQVPSDQQTPSRLERYLWDLACGLASNRRRSRARSNIVPIVGDHISPTPGAERSTVERDRLRRLLDCLEHTGSRLFLYFKLRFEDGLAPREIARVTGWSMKSTYKLRQSLDQAVEDCRRTLDPSGETP